ATRHQNNRETADTRTYWTSPLRHRIQLSRWQRHPTRMGRTKPMTRRQKAHVLSFKPHVLPTFQDMTRDPLDREGLLWKMVEARGLEPLTLCLQSRCATNCAMPPKVI